MKLSPEKIMDIAQDLSMDLEVYLNKKTLETIQVPTQTFYDEELLEVYKDDFEKIKRDKNDLYLIPKWNSREAYHFMHAFVMELPDSNFEKQNLLVALNSPHPFRKFKFIIDHSDLRKDWFAHQLKMQTEFVRAYLDTLE
jgi:hypothetical protein